MNNKEIPSNISGDYPIPEVPKTDSSEPSNSDIEMFKKLYLPSSKANYPPSEERIERTNGLNSLNASRPHKSL